MTFRNACFVALGVILAVQLVIAYSSIVLLGMPYYYALIATTTFGIVSGFLGPFVVERLTSKDEDSINE